MATPRADSARAALIWRIESLELDVVRVQADWTSKEIDFDAGSFSIDVLAAGTDDLVRGLTVRFLARVLVSAAARVDDDRLKDCLMEKTEALRGRLPPTQAPSAD